MRFYVVRHARYIYSLDDYQKLKDGQFPSEQGIKETEAFAKKISKLKIAVVYTNTVNRSKVPARMIAKANKYKPKVIVAKDIDPMSVNYKGKDIIEHVKSAKSRARTGERWIDGELPSIEPIADFMARVLRAFSKIMAKHYCRKEDVLVVVHWETFAAIESTFKGVSFRKSCRAHETFKYNKLYEFRI